MFKYSNITEEQLQEILAKMKSNPETKPADVVEVRQPAQAVTVCKYAEDTGELAFLRAPCRGNKIICKKVEGHISFTKACNPEQCKFFEALES